MTYNMKILAEISDATLGIGPAEQLGGTYQLRKGARAILRNEAGEIALQHLQNYHFYKLPGGGVDDGETVEDGLKREIKEEVGCDCQIIRPIGIVIEYRAKYQLLHINYCFEVRVAGSIGPVAFEEAEIKAGQTNIWAAPHEVLDLVRKGTRTTYESNFIIPRELAFLEEFLQTTQI